MDIGFYILSGVLKLNLLKNKVMENEIVTVYGNPLTKAGLAEEAEILEVLKEMNELRYCKVRMISTGRECNVFIKK